MTARANVPGKRPDGQARRYYLDAAVKRIHLLATRTGRLTYCGITTEPGKPVQPGRAKAAAIEQRTDPEVQGYSVCRTCFNSEAPQPDPKIWGPKRPTDR